MLSVKVVFKMRGAMEINAEIASKIWYLRPIIFFLFISSFNH